MIQKWNLKQPHETLVVAAILLQPIREEILHFRSINRASVPLQSRLN